MSLWFQPKVLMSRSQVVTKLLFTEISIFSNHYAVIRYLNIVVKIVFEVFETEFRGLFSNSWFPFLSNSASSVADSAFFWRNSEILYCQVKKTNQVFDKWIVSFYLLMSKLIRLRNSKDINFCPFGHSKSPQLIPSWSVYLSLTSLSN